MKKRINANTYAIDPSQSFLIDANVWLYVAGPQASQSNLSTRNYSRLLRDLISSGAKLFYTDMIISEYINRVLRIYFDVYKASSGNQQISFKNYRSTPDYINSMRQAKVGLDFIASTAHPVELEGWSTYLKGISTFMLKNSSDYNDIVISETSIVCNMVLVSNDGDMAIYDCDTLSFHRNLF